MNQGEDFMECHKGFEGGSFDKTIYFISYRVVKRGSKGRGFPNIP